MLQSIVDFGEILVARSDDAASRHRRHQGRRERVAALRALFREQQYSRYPVFNENLDNIVGFVLVKDLLLVEEANMDERLVATLMRPATFVPETKRVPDLLKEFQRKQLQLAIVVDEYGGTAGLVTIEDLLEEIVGEIRDEYDVETEPIVDEGQGVFVVSGEGRHRRSRGAARRRHRTRRLRDGRRLPAVTPGTRARRGRDVRSRRPDVEVLEAERRRIHKVRVDGRCTRPAAGALDMTAFRIRFAPRPAQRRQIHAAQQARRRQAGHRLGQAADDAHAHSRRQRHR